MSKIKVTGFSSTSGWEESYWGGFKKVLWDHPEIKLDHNIEFESKDKGELGYYNFSKLMKLFLLHAKRSGVNATLMENLRAEKKTIWFKNYTRYTLHPDRIRTVVNYLIDSGIELSNMFKHYQEIIGNTEIFYDVPEDQPQNDQDSKGDGQGEGDGDDGGDDGKDENKQKEAEKQLMEMLQEIEEMKPYSPSGNWYGGWGDMSDKQPIFKIIEESSPTQYTDEEVFHSNRLVNLLDITFDPAVDKIGALKSGKLEVSKICEIPSGNFNVYYRKEENISTKPFSVCVLIDESGSMGNRHHDTSRMGYAKSMAKVLYRTFSQIIPQDKLYFYGHSGEQRPVISVYHDKYNQNFERTIHAVGRYTSGNWDGPVMNNIYEKIRGYTTDNIIFIVISDGQPCAWGGIEPIQDMKRIIEKCTRDGFVTMGIGVQSDHVRRMYSYNTVVYNMAKEFVKKVSFLINRVVKQEFQS